MSPADDVLRFEVRLQEAIDLFARKLRHHLGGSSPADRTGLDLAGSSQRLEALRAEDARLRRRAKRGAPGYDFNRHIAVRRLIALGGATPEPTS